MTFNNDTVTPMIDKIIYNWVKENFGEAEALDPSWSIIELAHELAKHKHELHQAIQEEYDLEDVETVAEGEGIELTDEEKELALHRLDKAENDRMATLTNIILNIENERN